jgi:NAD(P)-dependent dehydrogenase (short-subunit alcohol dehydrogenase family)
MAGEQRVVVVTGASSGVGRAAATEFGARGDRVALLARGAEGLAGARRDVEAAGGRALPLPCDLVDAEAVEAAADRVEAELGPIDVWVNNAMTTVFAFLDEIEPDEFRRATEVTYLGGVWGTMAALRRMLPRDRGVIVQVGSALAYRSIPLQTAYCGAKHALLGFTESLRAELLHRRSGVRLTMVHLPGLNTPQFSHCRARLPNHPQPVPPIYQPEVAARAIVWASERNRRQVWVGGSTVATILANRLMPGVLDHYLGRTNVQAQQTGEPVDPDRPDNLFSPAPGDPGAHGIFDDQAHPRSVQLTLAEHRRALGLAGLTAAAGAAAAGILARMR